MEWPTLPRGFQRPLESLCTAHLVVAMRVEVRLQPLWCSPCQTARLALAVLLSGLKGYLIGICLCFGIPTPLVAFVVEMICERNVQFEKLHQGSGEENVLH